MPPPIPTPPPGPPTPQPIVVTIPQDVLDQLSHQGGLSQAWATIIAALIAVLAAGIALFGVWLGLRADRTQSQRRERVRVFAETVEQSNQMLDVGIIIEDSRKAGQYDTKQADRFLELLLKTRLTEAMLQIEGLEESGEAFKQFREAMVDFVKPGGDQPASSTVVDLHAEMLRVFTEQVSSGLPSRRVMDVMRSLRGGAT